MIEQIRASVDSLRSSRASHGHSLRAARRAGVEMIRAILAICAADLAREATEIPRWAAWVADEQRVDIRAGVILIDNRERSESRNAERWEGTILYWTNIGFVVAHRDEETYRCWNQGESDPSYDILTNGYTIGTREAVRKYGADELARAILGAIDRSKAAHEAQTDKEKDRAKRFAASLAALVA